MNNEYFCNFSDLKDKKEEWTHYKVIVAEGFLMRNVAKKLWYLSLSGLEENIINIPGTIGIRIIMGNLENLNIWLLIKSLNKVKVIIQEGELYELSKKLFKLRERGILLKDKKYGKWSYIWFNKRK